MEDSPPKYSEVIQQSSPVSGPSNSSNLFPNSKIKFPKSGKNLDKNYRSINPNQIIIDMTMNNQVANPPSDTR